MAKRRSSKKSDSFVFHPTGVCTTTITFKVTGGKLYNVNFNGGCSGNTQGLSKLLEGMEIEEVHKRLHGIRCGTKNSSCPDQMAAAVEVYVRKKLKRDITKPVIA